MAINAATVWEVRTTGQQTNGGGFYDRDPGTSVDYSQQDAAQLALTDIATDGAGTGISSVTGGFTAAMVGNIIFLTGGTATEGWYEITAVADTNTATIDRSAGLSKTNVTGNVGGAFKWGGALDGNFCTTNMKVAGNIIYIKAGTYTLGENTSCISSLFQSPLQFIGYNTTRGDNPIGTNRPLIDCTDSYFWNMAGNYTISKNLRFTGSYTNVVFSGTSLFSNCKSENTSGTANRYAFNGIIINLSFCECISTNGVAVRTTSESVTNFCYIHDSKTGLEAGTAALSVVNCIIDTCSTYGIYLNGSRYGTISGNTIYGCGIGIHTASIFNNSFINNIITGCTTGMDANSVYLMNQLFNNCWNNTTDVVNITKGDTDITADPLLNDPANGDFTLASGSPCFNAGMQLGASVGL